MPLDQSGSLLSLHLVRIPRLRSNSDAHHFLSSRRDSPHLGLGGSVTELSVTDVSQRAAR